MTTNTPKTDAKVSRVKEKIDTTVDFKDYKPAPGRFKIKDYETFEKFVDDYFEEAQEWNDKTHKWTQKYHPSMTGLALHCGLSYKGFWVEQPKRGEDFKSLVSESKARIEEHNIQQLYRKNQVTGVIFNLKNNFGWKDKQEIEHDHKGTISLSSVLKQVEQKELLDDGVVEAEIIDESRKPRQALEAPEE
jgi:hypothetical protein